MSVAEEQLRRAVVRIVDRGRRVVGTGFFVTRDLVATCAHVVCEALRKDDIEGGEQVEIQLLTGMPEGQDFVLATVEREYFRDKDAADVALLRLQCPLPDGIEPLALATSVGMDGRGLRGWGFPKAQPDGFSMKATVDALVDHPRKGRRLQLDSTKILPGCSGGPLWDEQGRVVGVAASILDQDRITGRGADISFAIAAEVLAGACRELSVETVERRAVAWHVPFLRNRSFVGREDDLARLHDLLQKGGAVGVRPAALTGMGGIGKTQLAVEYAYRYRDAYPGGVYWVNAVQPVQAEFARLAIASGLTVGVTPDSERTMRLALAFAKHLGERPDALAIFDNVDNPLTLRSPEPGFIPEQLGCRLLFTTRRRAPASPFETVDVRVLPDGVALRLLLGETRRGLLDGGPGAEVDGAKAICGSVGCLPLALVLAAAFLARYPRIAVADYLKRIRKEGALAAADATKVDPITLGTRHDAAVGATLRTQWDALESEDAKLVLKAAALLGEAAVVPRARLSLLTGLAEEAEPGYPAAMEEALLELRGLSLAEELTDQEIRLHPLVREFAETQIAGREAFAAECAGWLGDALWDMGRLHKEVAGRGVDAVLGDLRVGRKLAGFWERRRIEALRRPLDRESHALRGWNAAKEPGFLLQQLRNRCFDMGVEEVCERAEAQLGERGWSWLRERIATNRESDALVRTLEGHTSYVRGVAVTSDGRFAVSASDDKTLKVWDLDTGQALRTLEGHTGSVDGVAVTLDGRFAISASADKTLKVWDFDTGQALRTLEGHTDYVYGVAVTSSFALPTL